MFSSVPANPPSLARGRAIVAQRLAIVALLGTVFAFPQSAHAQAADTMSASLTRRLAEAAEGPRDGQVHWIVADPAWPHRICGIFPTFGAADSSRSTDPACRVYGPFRSPPYFGRPPVILVGCSHRDHPISSIWRLVCPERIIPRDSVLSLKLVVQTAQGLIETDLRGVDAVFLTGSSIRKFVLPYYSQLYGPRYAQELWDSVDTRVRRSTP